MKDLLRIAKKSAKRTFSNLRIKSPLRCNLLECEIMVSRKFLDHITALNHDRSLEERLERILIIPFIEDILREGIIRSERYQKRSLFYEISKPFGKDIFSIVIFKKEDTWYLLSCFRKKEKRPVLTSTGSSS